ncbi:MAG: serine hydrolase domain-containing protein [Asticcacaulis sp.]
MLKRLILVVLAVVVLLIAAGGLYVFTLIETRPDETPAVTSVTYVKSYEASGQKANEWIQALYTHNKMPSVSAAVGVNGQLVWAGAIGYTDIKGLHAARLSDTYRIGSISKSLTGAAVMRLVENRQIELDAPVSEYVPDYAEGNASYTIRQLLSHQAGIRNYSQDIGEIFNSKTYASTREAATLIENDPLAFEPGTGFNYSTYGYTVLALAMEGATGRPFEIIMYEEVLKPSGMTRTQPYRSDALTKPAKPYMLISGALIEAPEDNVSYKYAGGGYVSTPSDVVRFGNKLLSSDFLTPEGRQSLWTPVPLNDGRVPPENYALGFIIGEGALGPYAQHGGTANGTFSYLLIYPERGIVVALASNYMPGKAGFDRQAVSEQLAALFAQ